MPVPAETPLIATATATLKGVGRTNQDHLVVTDNAVAVLDGATAWLPQDPFRDGGWYARPLGAQLADLFGDVDRSLAEILGEAITRMRDRFGLPAGTSPQSTVAMARWTTDSLDVLVLLSDRASAAVDEYSRPATWQQVRDALAVAGPDAFLAQLHAIEATDPDGRRWPRSKCHDDKSLAYLVRADQRGRAERGS